jgi:hypothetical protein
MGQTAEIQAVILVAGVVACVATASIIITCAVFPPVRRKRFMKFILYMSTCDFGMGIITLFGFPESGSNLCSAQGILCIYFSLCSWFWTTALSYVSYSYVMYGKCWISDAVLHVVCWSLPLVLVLLPFINAKYGSSSQDSVQWCLIVNDSRSPSYASLVWSYVSYFFWLFLCCGCMLFWAARVYWLLRTRRDTLSATVIKTYQRVAWYPVAMIGFWILNYICNDFRSDENNLYAGISMLTGVSYGTATAVIFWLKSEECRTRWSDLLNSYRQKERPTMTAVPIDFEDDMDVIEDVRSTVHHVSADSVMSKEASIMIKSFGNVEVTVDGLDLSRSWNSGFNRPSDSLAMHQL